MTKLFWNVLRVSPVVAATILSANSVLANEVKEPTTSVAQLSSDKISQTTSVSQFRDVQPRDWAFQALQSLVERYNCISGYPDGTFRGNRTLNRFEFAASLNACLERVSELIASSTADAVKKEDLATLQRLQEEFSAELATLRGQVDALEARTSELEGNQFSTTTKLKGEAIFSATQAFGKGVAGSTSNSIDSNSNFTFSDRVRLTLESSFAGKDKLQIRLNAGNVANLNGSATAGGTGTNMARLGYDGSNGNTVVIDKINYAFNPLPNLSVKIDAIGADLDDNFEQFNPDFKSSGSGSISRYGRFSPIYRQARGGSGIAVNLKPNDQFTLGAGYYARGNDTASNPSATTGLFEGSNAIFGQLAFKPNKAINLGLTYARTYQQQSGVVTDVFDGTGGSSRITTPLDKLEANHYGVQFNIVPSPKLSFGGWVGYTTVNTLVSPTSSGDAWYWAGNVAFKDFLIEGNTLGLVFGQPPKFTGGKTGTTNIPGESTSSYHLEGLYKIKLSDNILLTPGVLVILDPQHNNNNPNIIVGTLRTTFSF
ncbi:MAG: iron uptake porin [Cylindrospermopsis raciborskii PAMP2012]|uniref:iron uptake porin n=1 Tax=Cylindrospermopsis raciborskii TaxID=77022 RepID=UPI000778C693|nr:iron uptake porin [Cylindrospermopsis raciborskii]MCZ2201642.1 iron uptake porin [Cylindrospermopsis raciborskii PAMP2012]